MLRLPEAFALTGSARFGSLPSAMGILDWSGNGTVADEALLITAAVGGIATLSSLWFQSRRTKKTIERIDSTLNHVDEPVGDDGPTVAQRVKAIGTRVDKLDTKIDRLHQDVQHLSNAMLDHISDESRRNLILEQKVRELDRRKDWSANGQQESQPD